MAIYAVSDLHGYFELYKKIKNFIQEGDIVYFLGDATDRGPQPWETAKAIYNDPQFIYLKGNHEELLEKSAFNYFSDDPWSDNSLYALLGNGGTNTWQSFINDFQKERWMFRLKNLPKEEIYVNKNNQVIYLSHAGKTPKSKEINLLWDRNHFKDKWPENEDNIYIVHGHTPVSYMRYVLYGKNTFQRKAIRPEFYANGHKINIDLETYNTKACCLLNLDTFEYHIFQLED